MTNHNSNSINITIIDRDGNAQTYEAPTDMNLNLMEFCRAIELPVKGECGGMAMCATCHVYVDPAWVDRLPAKDSMEEDMLDFAWTPDPARSRLTCQLKVSDALDGLRVQMPEKQI